MQSCASSMRARVPGTAVLCEILTHGAALGAAAATHVVGRRGEKRVPGASVRQFVCSRGDQFSSVSCVCVCYCAFVFVFVCCCLRRSLAHSLSHTLFMSMHIIIFQFNILRALQHLPSLPYVLRLFVSLYILCLVLLIAHHTHITRNTHRKKPIQDPSINKRPAQYIHYNILSNLNCQKCQCL